MIIKIRKNCIIIKCDEKKRTLPTKDSLFPNCEQTLMENIRQ